MYKINSRWRKPKRRPSKKTKSSKANIEKRWEENPSAVNAVNKNVNIVNTSKIVNNNANVSASEKKILKTADIIKEKKLDFDTNDSHSYTIIGKEMWEDLLKNLSCFQCFEKSLKVAMKENYGFSSKIQLICLACGTVVGSAFTSSRNSQYEQFHVNKDLVQAFLSFGKGLSAIEKFSMSLGLPAMDRKTFTKSVSSLSTETLEVQTTALEISRELIRKEHMELDSSLEEGEILDISVTYDGSWHKRGHSSLYGFFSVIDLLTGLVIDYEVLSKYCAKCNTAIHDLGKNTPEYHIWFDGHKDECEKNFEGSSNSMEVHAAILLWKRSIALCNMRYRTILSDGDGKAFLSLQEQNIYGSNYPIKKEECINHVSKRMGTALRNKVKEWKTKKVCLGGRKRGSLTDNTITCLTKYYQKAIKDNAPNLENIKSAIYASLYHCMSTDIKPNHKKCPIGVSSWCFYNRALAKCEVPKSHSLMKVALREDVVAKILPVYQRLAANSLLEKCLLNETQNNNESLHAVIWSNCPKEIFISKKRLHIAIANSICEFNLGLENLIRLRAENLTDSCLPSATVKIAKARDQRRISQSKKRSKNSYKIKRIAKKFKKSQLETKIIEKEGITYKAGNF